MAALLWRRVIWVLGLLLVWQSQQAAPQTSAIVFTHATVIDGSGAAAMADMTVTIEHGQITGLEPSAKAGVPKSARVIDASGKYLIPGLWDMHVHWYDRRFLGLFLANGVTGIRVMWGGPLHLMWRKDIAAGTLDGPRMFVASAIVDGPNPVWPGSTVVTGDADARAAVQAIKRDGYDFVKVYNRIPRDAYFAIADEAGRVGLTFAGHVPNAVTPMEASDAHQKSIEHMDGLLSGVSSVEAEVRKRAADLSTGGEAGRGITAESRAARRELSERILATADPAKASQLFERFVRNGTWQCPTLTVLRAIASLDDQAFVSDARLKYMPASLRTQWRPANDPRLATKTAADYEVGRRVLKKQFEMVGAMNRAGVKLVAGTDTLNPFVFPGFSLHDELALLVEAGLTPMQALQAATSSAAAFMGRSDLGTLKRGNAGDVVLLNGNPLDNIRNTTTVAAVVANGRFYDRAALDRMLADAEKLAGEGVR